MLNVLMCFFSGNPMGFFFSMGVKPTSGGHTYIGNSHCYGLVVIEPFLQPSDYLMSRLLGLTGERSKLASFI